ncbi:MAG TPA: hypothetical protein VGQ81_02380 [Acidobacteriota bacterium]|nr:hypothetical protein [Acidobacteriota bacterium]
MSPRPRVPLSPRPPVRLSPSPRVSLSACLLLFFIFLEACCLLQAEIVDRVAATVNNRVITLSDVEWSFVGSPKPLPANSEERKKAMDAALEELIERELITQEVEKEPLFALREEDVDSELKKMETRYGGHPKLEAELQKSGLSLDQLRVMIRRQLAVAKFVEARFRPFIIVLPDEIAAYYRETYVPALKKEGITTPSPVEKVSDQIEKVLIEQKLDQELDKWLSNARKHAKIVKLLFREQSPNIPPPELIKSTKGKDQKPAVAGRK